MPQITIDGPKLEDLERKRALVRKITDAVVEAYGSPREHTTVLIREHSAENFGVGGELLIDRRGRKGREGPSPD